MPFKIADPNALPTPPDQTELPVPDPADQEIKPALTAKIKEVRSSVLAAKAKEEAEARAAILDAPEAPILRGAGKALRTVRQTYDAQRAELSANRNLTSEGKKEATRKLAAAFKEQTDRIAEHTLSKTGDALLTRFPEKALGALDPADAAEIEVAYVSFPHKAGSTFLAEHTLKARRWLDPSTPAGERYKLSKYFTHAGLPLIERRAVSPERPSRHLQAEYQELAGLVRAHLDTTLQNERTRLASLLVSKARDGFSWLTAMSEKDGAWDSFIYEPVCPVFDWDND